VFVHDEHGAPQDYESTRKSDGGSTAGVSDAVLGVIGPRHCPLMEVRADPLSLES
jgi:hypothetical protein